MAGRPAHRGGVVMTVFRLVVMMAIAVVVGFDIGAVFVEWTFR